MAKREAIVIETPEDYLLRSWCDAEQGLHKGAVEPTNVPDPEPHPNEVATRKAVEAGIYAADHAGL